MLFGEAAMMGGDVHGTDKLGQMPRDALDHTPRVGKDEGGAMLAHKAREPVINFAPHVGRHHRFERR